MKLRKNFPELPFAEKSIQCILLIDKEDKRQPIRVGIPVIDFILNAKLFPIVSDFTTMQERFDEFLYFQSYWSQN